MSEPPQKAIPVLPSGPLPDRHIDEDVACKQCGYNLRTLSVDGHCPECNTAVHHSLVGYYLGHAPPEWVRRLSRGVLFLIIGAILSALAGLVIGGWVAIQAFLRSGGSFGGQFPGFDLRSLTLAGTLVSLPALVFQTMGLLWLTTRNPSDPPGEAFGPARPWLRGSIALLVGVALLGWVPGLLPDLLLPTVTRGWLSAAIQPVSGGAFALVLVLLMWHLGQLMARIPRPGLARFARIVLWGCLICGGLTIVGQTLSIGRTASTFAAMQGVTPPPAVPATTSAAASSAPAPITAPPGAFAPTTPVPAMVVQGITGYGACIYLCFMIAGFVLLFYVRGALGGAAREAEYSPSHPPPNDAS